MNQSYSKRIRKKAGIIVLLGWIASVSLSFIGKGEDKFAVRTIVIDAGHGGKDPGCLGKGGGREKNVTLAVALKLGKMIQAQFKDVKVVYTRDKDVFVEVKERAVIANRVKADLFISIHCNASVKADITGSETYIMALKNETGNLELAKRENSAILLEEDYEKNYEGFDPNSPEGYIILSMIQNAFIDQSLNLAGKIQTEYGKIHGLQDKGVKRASLWVLWKTAMPSLLTEIGFLTNPEEEKLLLSENGQNDIANGLFDAVKHYKNEMEGTGGQSKSNETKEEVLAIAEPEPTKTQVESKEADPVQEIAPEEPQTEPDHRVETEEVKQERPPEETKAEEPKHIENKTVETKAEITENSSDAAVKANNSEESTHKEPSKLYQKPVKEEAKKPNPVAQKVEKPIEKPKPKETSPKQNVNTNGEIVFKVQIFTSDKKIPLTSDKFKGLTKASEYKHMGMFKYCVGETNVYEEVVHLQNEIRKGDYKQAFAVAFRNGERMDLIEAKKIVQGLK